MANKFKRDYDKGTVTLSDGRVINVLELPANSLNYFAVYGFIRACQDPNGGEKDDVKRNALNMAVAEALISGTHEKKTRTFGVGLEDKLDEANARLVMYTSTTDAEKRMLASMGINRTGIMAEITRIEKAIAKRDAKLAPAKPTATAETETETETEVSSIE